MNTELVAVFIDTSLDTFFAISIHPDATVKQLISKLEVEHYSCFQEFGRINITSLQVKRGCHMYYLSQCVPLKALFKSCNAWSVHAVASQISSTKEPSYQPETPTHVTENKDQEKASNYKSRSFDIGNRVVRAAERLTPCSKRFKLSKLLLASEKRYTTVMANAFSFK